MRLALRALVRATLAVVPLPLIDVARGWYRAAPSDGVRARLLRSALGVLRHRRLGASMTAVRLEPMGITFSNDESVLTRRLYYLGDYEAGEWRWWEHWCRRSSRVVELGANTGLYSVIGGRVTTLDDYVAVEPHPRTAQVLRANLALNGIARVRVVEAAVSGERTPSRMELLVPRQDRDATPTGAFLSSAVDHDGESRESITVDVIEARALLERADLIKMDIEGQELAVLRSVEDLLAARRPTIFLELRSGSTSLRDYVPTLCRRCGYRVFAMGGDALHPIDLAALPGINFNRAFGTRDVILTAEDASAHAAPDLDRPTVARSGVAP